MGVMREVRVCVLRCRHTEEIVKFPPTDVRDGKEMLVRALKFWRMIKGWRKSKGRGGEG